MNNVPTTNTNRLGNRNGARILFLLCLSHVVERREEVEMNYKIKVTAVKWIELDVEAGHRQPFDNYEDELSEAAIDMMIDQIQRFDVDDIEWDAEVMEGTE